MWMHVHLSDRLRSISNGKFAQWIQSRWWSTVRGPLRTSNDSCTPHRTLKHQTFRLAAKIYERTLSLYCFRYWIRRLFVKSNPIIKIKVWKTVFFFAVINFASFVHFVLLSLGASAWYHMSMCVCVCFGLCCGQLLAFFRFVFSVIHCNRLNLCMKSTKSGLWIAWCRRLKHNYMAKQKPHTTEYFFFCSWIQYTQQ